MILIGKYIEFVMRLWIRIKAKAFTKILSICFFSIGKKTTIIPPLRFTNLSLIQLGSGITIHSHCWIQALKLNERGSSPKIIIKDYAAIGMNTTISAAKSIVIEEHVFTGRNVYISDHGHKFEDITMPIGNQGIRKAIEVRIGAKTWLGQNAVILPGVTIGRHCIIGANSVVTSHIPDYTIAAGVPAKAINRYNSSTKSWERIK